MRNYVTNLNAIINRYGKNPADIRFIVKLDIAKNVFQVYAVDLDSGELINKAIKRDHFKVRLTVKEFFANIATALIGIEACGTSQYWARELTPLGHVVRLQHP